MALTFINRGSGGSLTIGGSLQLSSAVIPPISPTYSTGGLVLNLDAAEYGGSGNWLDLTANGNNANDARLVLGRQLIEGTGKFPKNVKKGFNWIKEAGKNGHIGALEYRVYHEIRFDKQPNMKKLQENLQTVVDKTKSARALNMLGEFYQI